MALFDDPFYFDVSITMCFCSTVYNLKYDNKSTDILLQLYKTRLSWIPAESRKVRKSKVVPG